MGGDWGPLNARSRGLGSTLLPRSSIGDAAGTGSPGELAGRLSRAGYPPDRGDLPSTARGLDRAVGRVHGWRLTVLHRWAGDLRELLPVVFEAEDRRSLRALLRGVREGASPERRLRGLVPTPTLPRTALERMAEARSIEDLSQLLRDEAHPLAGALRDTASPPLSPADLYEAELALDRAFAQRATGAASGDRELQGFAARIVDRANAWTLLLADAAEGEPGPEDLRLPGGEAFPEEQFASIYGVEDGEERRRLVAEQLGGRGGELLSDPTVSPARLGDHLLESDIRWTRDRALRSPLGPWPFLHLVLRSRAESRDLRSLVWSAAMGAPASAFRPVSPS